MKTTRRRSAHKNAIDSRILFHSKWDDAEAEEQGRVVPRSVV